MDFGDSLVEVGFLDEDGIQHWDEEWKKETRIHQRLHHVKYKHGQM
jgi:hypothetical protein